MFGKFRKKSKLEAEIDLQMSVLREMRYDEEQYDTILSRIEKLHKMRDRRVSPETWAMIGANLLGIVIIITHEYTHPVTTKALNLAFKVGRPTP